MRTSADAAALLLRDAAGYFRGFAEEKPGQAEEWLTRVDLFEAVACIVQERPAGPVPDRWPMAAEIERSRQDAARKWMAEVPGAEPPGH